MFERFTKEAARVVMDAHTEANRLGHDHVGTEHLLLALTMGTDTAADGLETAGITHGGAESAAVATNLREADAEALGVIGIDLDEVTKAVEASFGEGALSDPISRKDHVPLTRGAIKTLELSLREAIHLGHKHIGSEHVLLGLLRNDTGSAYEWLVKGGCDISALRDAVAEKMKRAS